jgi:hypothetical protein
MFDSAMTIIKNISIILVFSSCVNGWYQEKKFAEEWLEDNEGEELIKKWVFSVISILSTSLSDKCQRRRKKVIISYLLFLISLFFLFIGSYFEGLSKG